MENNEWNLSKEIQKEGENTWGCKWGFVDVLDIKRFLHKLKDEISGYDSQLYIDYPISKIIDKLAGEDFLK